MLDRVMSWACLHQQPISTCVSPETPAKYEVVTAGEYVKSRLDATYTHSAKWSLGIRYCRYRLLLVPCKWRRAYDDISCVFISVIPRSHRSQVRIRNSIERDNVDWKVYWILKDTLKEFDKWRVADLLNVKLTLGFLPAPNRWNPRGRPIYNMTKAFAALRTSI
jgi:hypothetical protein